MHSGGNASSLPLVGGAPEPTINQLSKPGRRASRFPKLDVPVSEINNSNHLNAGKSFSESINDNVCLNTKQLNSYQTIFTRNYFF